MVRSHSSTTATFSNFEPLIFRRKNKPILFSNTSSSASSVVNKHTLFLFCNYNKRFSFDKMKFSATIILSTAISCTAMASTTVDRATGGNGVHVPVGKDGEGLYTASTKGCFDVIDTATPLIMNEIEKQPVRPFGSPAFHIADFGTADAGTSLGLMTKMVEGVRNKVGDKEKEVVIHYEDQLT